MTGSTMPSDGNTEIELLQAEIMQEKQMMEMLRQSLAELQVTVDELDNRMDNVGNENNEWKTRFENQAELNQQLQRQILMLQERIEEAAKTYKESRQPKSRTTGAELGEVTPYLIERLEKEKGSLDKSVRNLEWRLDQESKAYHKANEERKQFVLEIGAAKDTINEMKVRQRHLDLAHQDNGPGTPRGIGNQNIPPDQRILDPKRGPIKKTAAVKNLPRLD